MKNDPRPYWQSSSFKMAVLFSVLLGICVSVVGYFNFYFNRNSFIQAAESIIDTEIRHLIAADKTGGLLKSLDTVMNVQGRIYVLKSAANQPLEANIQNLPADIDVLDEGTIVFDHAEKHYAARIHTFPDGRTLLIGVDITKADRMYGWMRFLSILSIVSMMIVISVSFLISTFVASRTNRIASTAKKIMDTGDLSQRIIVDSPWDDLSNMAHVLNMFLNRVEKLMIGIKQVSDNIAHDLRTPLTRLHNELETLRGHERIIVDSELHSYCDKMVGETNHLLNTFQALLRIARIESGKKTQNFMLVNLASIITDIVDLYDPLADEKSIRIEVSLESSTPLQGDPDMLFQAIANILDNSVKFTPAGGLITLIATVQGGRNVIRLSDSGPGVPDHEKDKIFDRFYRGDKSRSAEGSGLGLSLVAAVVNLHGGKIRLLDGNPGLITEIIL